MDLSQIYTELIREHSMDSPHKHEMENPTHSQMGVNPSCGDEIKLNIKLNGDIIEDASYDGIGCAISQASTSMMIDVIKGKTVAEAKEAIELFLSMIKDGDKSEEDLLLIEDAAVLQSISKLPQRVKCAVLAWRTLDKILNNQ